MKKKRKYSLILVIVVFVLSMGVFFLLYYVDNKYTAGVTRQYRVFFMYARMILCIILPESGNIIRICCCHPGNLKNIKESTTADIFL